MARAGRSAPKHAAEGRPAQGASLESPAAPRHRAVRPRRALRSLRIAGPVVVAASLVTTVTAAQRGEDRLERRQSAPVAFAPADLSLRTANVSRSTARAALPTATAKRTTLQPAPVDHEYAAAPLNVWAGPGEGTERLRVLPLGTRLAVTGQTSGRWAEVLVTREVPAAGRAGRDGGQATRAVTVARWVNGDFLAERKPAPPEATEPEATQPEEVATSTATTATTGISGAYCPDGSSIESGLTSSAVQVYRAVCAAYPALSSYGGYDPHGEHVDGRAIDFMVTDSALGQAVADYLLANAGTLGIRDIIWAQRIWTPERASEGWRWMEDRGDPTANHYDHVHVAVY